MSDQISERETIEALENHRTKEIIKLSNENANYRFGLGSSPLVWHYLTHNLSADLLPLIANVAASPEGNWQAQRAGLQALLVSKCAEFGDFRPYWSALSNSCQLCSVPVDDRLHRAAVQQLVNFPNPILQFAIAQAKNGTKGWIGLIQAAIPLYTQWYQMQLPAVDLLNDLVAINIENCEIVPIIEETNLVLFKIIDAILHIGSSTVSSTVPRDVYLAVYQTFEALAGGSKQLFIDRNEETSSWPILILQMEILTHILENDVSAKHVLTETGIVQSIVILLANCKQFLPVYNKLGTAPKEPEPRDFPMVKSSAIALLSQVVVNNPKAQDEARELGGLALVLESCVIDTNNPYIKERAVICIRYLLENNQQNQNFVASLEAKQVVDPDALERAGFEANIVDGKITLKGCK